MWWTKDDIAKYVVGYSNNNAAADVLLSVNKQLTTTVNNTSSSSFSESIGYCSVWNICNRVTCSINRFICKGVCTRWGQVIAIIIPLRNIT